MRCWNSSNIRTLCWHIYFIYFQTPKKNKELKSLYQELKGWYQMCDSRVKPLTGHGTRWIYHKLWAMGSYSKGLFVVHFKDYMCSAKNSAARASENWKNWRMQSFLCSGFITDVLAEVKKFSLLMQDENVSVIKLLNAAESTKSN